MQDRNLSLNLNDGQGWAAMIPALLCKCMDPATKQALTAYTRVVVNMATLVFVCRTKPSLLA